MADSKDWIVRYYASHDDIPEGQYDGHIVRELIRCKDCKHYYEKEWLVGGGSYKTCWNNCIAVANENDYCSRAERKTE